MMGVFKACDIRGVYKKELTEALCLDIGSALGYKIRGRDVVVGGDLRESTPCLKEKVMEGLRNSGAKVIDLGILPTPVFYFAKAHFNAYAGVMVTASHNPKEFNGIKFLLGDFPPLEHDVKEIEKLIKEKRQKFRQSAGSKKNKKIRKIKSFSLEKIYIQFIKNEILRFGSIKKKFKIVVDAGNGSFSKIAPEFFRGLGFKVIPLFCEPDGRFPERNPNPIIPGALDRLSQKVKEENAALGVAYDGDGDRIVFVDEKGVIVPTDKAIVILGKIVTEKEGPGKIVYDIKCSEAVPDEFKRLGCVPLMEKAGHSYIKTRLIKEKAVFGGEVSGHFFFGRLKRDESLLATVLVALKMAREDKALSELASLVPEYFSTPDIRIPYPEDREEVLDKIKENGKGFEINRMDGVRISYSEGWGLVRISITEPLLTFRFEAKTKDRLRKVIKRFLNPVPEIAKEIEVKYGNYYN